MIAYPHLLKVDVKLSFVFIVDNPEHPLVLIEWASHAHTPITSHLIEFVIVVSTQFHILVVHPPQSTSLALGPIEFIVPFLNKKFYKFY